MAGTLFENNLSPYLTMVEGTAPASPSAGDQRLFVDSADHLLKYKNSSGTITPVGNGIQDQGAFTYLDGTVAAAPGTPASGKLRLYAKTGKVLAVKDDAGVETVLGAGGGGITHSYIGYNTQGASVENGTNGIMWCTSVTLASAGLIASIGAYVKEDGDGTPEAVAALFQDNSTAPGIMLAEVLAPQASLKIGATFNQRWLHLPIGLWLAAGTYWLGFGSFTGNAQNMAIAYDGSGTDQKFTSANTWTADGGRYTLTTTTNKYSIRADFLS